jgi:hypothetical protein
MRTDLPDVSDMPEFRNVKRRCWPFPFKSWVSNFDIASIRCV